jgi:hypothetical protein
MGRNGRRIVCALCQIKIRLARKENRRLVKGIKK